MQSCTRWVLACCIAAKVGGGGGKGGREGGREKLLVEHAVRQPYFAMMLYALMALGYFLGVPSFSLPSACILTCRRQHWRLQAVYCVCGNKMIVPTHVQMEQL